MTVNEVMKEVSLLFRQPVKHNSALPGYNLGEGGFIGQYFVGNNPAREAVEAATVLTANYKVTFLVSIFAELQIMKQNSAYADVYDFSHIGAETGKDTMAKGVTFMLTSINKAIHGDRCMGLYEIGEIIHINELINVAPL